MGSFKTGGLDLGLSICQTACEALSFLGSQTQELGDKGVAACKAKRAILNGKGTKKSAKVSADEQFDVLYKQFRDETKFHRAAEHLKGTAVKDDSPITRTMLARAKVNLCDLEDLEDYEPEEPKKSSKSKAPEVEPEDEPEDEPEEPEDEDDEDEETAPPVRKKKAPPVESTRPKKVKGTRKIRKAKEVAEDDFDEKYRYN